MTDDDENPTTRKPARSIALRDATVPLPRSARDPSGVINSTAIGWQARKRAKALREQADADRAYADKVKARGEVAEAFVNTARSVNKLQELTQILDNDAAVRAAQRETERAEAEFASLEARAKRDAKEKLMARQLELGSTRLDGRIADAGITTAIHRTTLAEHAAETRKGNGKSGQSDDETIRSYDQLIATQIELRHAAAARGDYQSMGELDKSITAVSAAKAAYLATLGKAQE